MFKGIILAIALLAFAACSKKSDDSTGASTITFAGKINGLTTASHISQMLSLKSVSGLDVQPFAASDYVLYCVTFAATPSASTSAFGTDGSFSVALPANTSFGCFINAVATNLPVATLVNAGSGSGMSDSKSAAFSLGSSVDVGSLTLDLVNNKVEIPAAALEGAKSTVTAGLSLADIDNYEWTMSCLPSGSAQIDAACQSSIMDDSPTGSSPVYLRVLQGTEGGATKYGMSVWESASAFTACGGIDMNTATKSAIEGSGFVFATTGDYTPATAASYTGWADTTNCPLRSANGQTEYASLTASTADAHQNLKKNFCLAPMVQTGTGYTFNCESEGSYTSGGNTCNYNHQTSVSMTPGSSAAEMFGYFVTSESRTGTGCGSSSDYSYAFTIKFVRGAKN